MSPKRANREVDAVVVGSGINALVCAALLARAGWRVAVLERSRELGGAIRTAELTQPGYLHDVFSCWHPMFVGGPAYAALAEDLRRRGLTYCNTDHPTATLSLGERPILLTTDRTKNIAEFATFAASDGAAYATAAQAFLADGDVNFGIMNTEPWSLAGLRLARSVQRTVGARGVAARVADQFTTARTWLTATFESPRLRALAAPWLLHAGMSPDSPGSAFLVQMLLVSLEMGGMPLPQGGGAQLVNALRAIVEDNRGELHLEANANRVLLARGRAVGVDTDIGPIRARRGVICSVTPQQLYTRLLPADAVSDEVRARAARFRYGNANLMVHLALTEPPEWRTHDAAELARTAVIHMTPGMNAVSSAFAEARLGVLPREPTIVCGQPMAVDSSRGPAGSWILWLQVPEVPTTPQRDAYDELQPGGRWTPSLSDRYADRIVALVSRHAPNVESAICGRHVISPADLEAANINLVGGDPYSGESSLDQMLLWRPLGGLTDHRTPVRALYHIGASTHPGGGLHGTSGYLVAQSLLRSRWWPKRWIQARAS